MLSALWRRLLSLTQRGRLSRELDEEILEHLGDLQREYQSQGLSPGESRRRARLRLGSPLRIREVSHDEWRLGWFEGVFLDLRLAARTLIRRPGYLTAVVSTLALGIGASTAIFSVAYGVSIRPLPYAQPDRLVRIYESNAANSLSKHNVSPKAFLEWRAGAPALESLAFVEKSGARTMVRPVRERVTVRSASPALFDLLGVSPLLGPGFRPEAEYTPSTARHVLLSHDAWRRLFGARPEVIGTGIVWATDDDVFEVVGVLPERFTFDSEVDMWVPEIMPASLPSSRAYDRDSEVIARLMPSASIAWAQAELEAVAARMAAENPRVSGGWSVTVESLHESVTGRFDRWTWLLCLAVVIVLLVSFVNVCALILARAVGRARETAVRVAMGGSKWRLLRLSLAEALVLAAVGTAPGLLVASSTVSALRAVAPPGIPRLDEVTLDAPVLALAVLSALVAIALFTVVPIGRAARGNPLVGLRSTSGGSDDRTRRALRALLTSAQCAGAVALAIVAVMLARSLVNLMNVDMGWEPDRLVSFQVSPRIDSGLGRPWYARVEWAHRLVSRLEATAGVDGAAITSQIPLLPDPYAATLARGRKPRPGDDHRWPVIAHKVTDGYFDVMGIRLVAGRRFGAIDRFTPEQINYGRYGQGDPAQRPEHGVAIVTQQTARVLWPGESALGQAISGTVLWSEVVGVVEDIQFHAVGEQPSLHVFIPWSQDSAWGTPHLVVRTTGQALPMVSTIRGVVDGVRPAADVNEVDLLDAVVARATAEPRFASRLVGAFGLVALGLAAVGIYGTLSYFVGARTREIGIRLALGARQRTLVSTVLWRGLTPAFIGGVVGVCLALVIARTFSSLLFQLDPVDWQSVVTGGIVLLMVALAAAVGPALRAARVDPVQALRTD